MDRQDWITEAAIGAAVLALGTLVVMTDARPHEAPKGWDYPWACCANQDCQQATVSLGAFVGMLTEPRPSNPNYVINKTGEQIAPNDKRIKNSPDGEYHWCAHRAGVDIDKTICLFVPPRGF